MKPKYVSAFPPCPRSPLPKVSHWAFSCFLTIPCTFLLPCLSSSLSLCLAHPPSLIVVWKPSILQCYFQRFLKKIPKNKPPFSHVFSWMWIYWCLSRQNHPFFSQWFVFVLFPSVQLWISLMQGLCFACVIFETLRLLLQEHEIEWKKSQGPNLVQWRGWATQIAHTVPLFGDS